MTAKLLENRIALITGASRGIGAAVAVRYAHEGAHVLLVARDIKGLEATDDTIRAFGGTATLIPLDLMETPLIERMAAQVKERFGKLDILVGNAGILGELSPLPHSDPLVWDKVMAVNLTANLHLIRCFDSLIKQSDAGRALFVTSGITLSANAYWGAYATSKAALEAMVKTYAAENLKTAMKINLIDPGIVRTNMRAQAFPGENPETIPAPENITDVFVELADPKQQETGKIFYIR